MALQWFCQRMVRVMIYQAPFINFSNANYGHESCFTLTAPFLTNVDLCIHLDWLMFQNCLHASPQRTRWLWWVLTVFSGGLLKFIQRTTGSFPTQAWWITVYRWWASHYNLPSFMAVILSIWGWWLDLLLSLTFCSKTMSFVFNKHHAASGLWEKGGKNLEDFRGVNSFSKRLFVQD